MITAQRIAHGEFAAGATVVRVVSRCCGACSAPHCWRCRGAAHMWRIRRQPDLVQCLGRRRLVGCPAWPIVPAVCLSHCPHTPRAGVWRAICAAPLPGGSCSACSVALLLLLYATCNVQRAVCHLPPACCKQLRSAIFVCVFKFFINPKNNDRNFRLATTPLRLLSPAASCPHTHSCNTHTHTHICNTHTHTHIYTKYANNFQLKINFMLQLRPSAKQLLLLLLQLLLLLLLLHAVAEVAHEMRKYHSQVYCHLGHFLALNEQKAVKLYWEHFKKFSSSCRAPKNFASCQKT